MVTIKDIAREGGVSVSTVSRALAESPLLPKSTCVKIKEIANRLGYVKNEAASSLKTGVAQTVGVLSFVDDALGFSHHLFAGILEGFAKQMNANNYEIFLLSKDSKEDGEQLISSLRSRNLSGVLILCGFLQSEKIQKLIQSDIPTVIIDGFDDIMSEMTHYVSSTNDKGMYALTKEILHKGHKNIAYVCGEDYYVTHERIKGFKRALAEYDVPFNKDMLVQGHYYKLPFVQSVVEQLLARENPPTCIVLPDDYCAVSAYEILRKMGYTIGKDISIAGFDGLEIGKHMQPRLTTVNQNVRELGGRAAKTLLASIKGETLPYMQLVDTQLEIGGSICDLNEM